MSLTGMKIKAAPSFFLLCSVLLWLDRDGIILIFLLSAALHECGHLLALVLLGVPVYGIELRASGAVLHTGNTSPAKEAVCAAAGPFVNFILLSILFRRQPTAALVNLLLLVYNLLPLYPLDGGRLLRLLLCSLFGAQAGERASDILTVLLTLAAALGGIVLTCIFHLGLYPCLLAGLFLCKQGISACKSCRVGLK